MVNLNRLTINLDKGKVLLFSSAESKKIKEIKRDINITINNTKLEIVSEYRYLGLIIDQKLDFCEHIKHIKSKISQRHYLLRKVRWSL